MQYPGPESLVARTRRLALIGDTQETALVERLIGMEQNAHLRARLLGELVARRPDGLLHVGDLVTFGSSPGHWRRLDALFEPLRVAGIPLMPAVGNHDRMVLARLGLDQLQRRFPMLRGRTWYRFRHAGVECVALDTNLAPGDAKAAAQLAWLADTLAAADADPAVDATIAFWHHPPLSNSRIVRPSALARERFVPALARSRKAIAIFSGHCHAYERFAIDGLACFVSGGGGGPRHTLETRPERRRGHDLFAGGALRFMHFLELELGPEALTVHVVRMGATGFDIAESVVVAHRRTGDPVSP